MSCTSSTPYICRNVVRHEGSDRSGFRREGHFPNAAALAAAVTVLEALGPGAREILVHYYVNREDPATIRSAYGITEEEFGRLRKSVRDAYQKLRRPSGPAE